jgi:hypothetical protein
MIKPEIETKQYKYSGSHRLGEAAIKVHGPVDPVAITEIPDKP